MLITALVSVQGFGTAGITSFRATKKGCVKHPRHRSALCSTGAIIIVSRISLAVNSKNVTKRDIFVKFRDKT